MLKALKKKNLLPDVRRIPKKSELVGLFEFTGPLMAITVTRLMGWIVMQRAAINLGVQHLAAYQLSLNILIFFLYFGEPLSQLSQTKLPALLDTIQSSNYTADNVFEMSTQIKKTFKSVLLLGCWASLGVGALAAGTLFFGSGLFSTDKAVIALAKDVTPSLFIAVSSTIFMSKYIVHGCWVFYVWFYMSRLRNQYMTCSFPTCSDG